MLINEELVIQSDMHNALEPRLLVRDLGIGIRLGIREKFNLNLNDKNQ